jgi:hypothetical protein
MCFRKQTYFGSTLDIETGLKYVNVQHRLPLVVVASLFSLSLPSPETAPLLQHLVSNSSMGFSFCIQDRQRDAQKQFEIDNGMPDDWNGML